MAKTGMVLCFVDPSTMVFGSHGRREAGAGCARRLCAEHADQCTDDGCDEVRRLLAPLWSILDEKGTQTMMKQVLGEAGSVADFDSVRKRLQAPGTGWTFSMASNST